MSSELENKRETVGDPTPTAAQLHEMIEAGDAQGLALGAGRWLLDTTKKRSRFACLSFDEGEGVPMTTLVIRQPEGGDA